MNGNKNVFINLSEFLDSENVQNENKYKNTK
jgi:hypothetical protein